MRFMLYEAERRFLTLLCKISAGMAKRLRFCWTLSVLDFLLAERATVLGKESVYCMNMTKRWQKNAGRCIAAFHQYEKEFKK